MIKKNTKSIVLGLVLIIYSIIYQTYILKHLLKYSESLSASIILIIMFLGILLFGYRKDNTNRLKKLVLYETIIIVITFFLITYFCGYVMGFNKNIYSLNPILLLNNIFMPILIIIGTEIYRYVICSTRSKREIIITTIILIIFESCINMRLKYLLTFSSAFRYITILILPIIIKNIFLTYLAKQGGLKPTIIYRILTEMYLLILPIIPAFSDYLNSVFRICLPVLALIYISTTVDNFNKESIKSERKANVPLINIILIIILITGVYLISGVFTYTLLGVGSDSMQPNISKGDAVIIKKIKSDKELKVGDIIAYDNSKNGKIIIHRIVEIKKDNKEKVYVTRGDNNKSVDNIKVTYKKIKGVVKLKIKYIATLTIYLNELLK